MAGGDQPDLSAFQLEVARLFFALPASKGFLLAGGAALLAQHLTSRPTEDLDYFTTPELGHVPAARDALAAAARHQTSPRLRHRPGDQNWYPGYLGPGFLSAAARSAKASRWLVRGMRRTPSPWMG